LFALFHLAVSQTEINVCFLHPLFSRLGDNSRTLLLAQHTFLISLALTTKEIFIMDPAGFEAMLHTQQQILVDAQRQKGQRATNKPSRQQLQMRFAQKVS